MHGISLKLRGKKNFTEIAFKLERGKWKKIFNTSTKAEFSLFSPTHLIHIVLAFQALHR